jgi:hypothetical protein
VILLETFLLVLAHYQLFLEIIAQALNCIFLTLANDILVVVRPLNKITHAFDHLSTQLTLVELRVKVLK